MKKEAGQTLIEVVIALATAVGIISAIATAIIASLNNTEFTKNQNLATEYAQQGMEIVRSIARSNWNSFAGTYTATYYCLSQNSQILSPRGSNCSPNVNNNTFVREIDIWQQNSQNSIDDCSGQVKVTTIVSWSDSKCSGSNNCHEVKLDSCLANINGIQNP